MIRTLGFAATGWIAAAMGAAMAQGGVPVPTLKGAAIVATTTTTASTARLAAQDEPAPAPQKTVLRGALSQGGLIQGKTLPGTRVMLDGTTVVVDGEGHFLLGFGRDHGPTAEVTLTFPSGERKVETLPIQEREWKESSITVDQGKVSGFSNRELEKIADDRSKKDQARRIRLSRPYWRDGFAWPTQGCITSPFGYRRIVNGEARRYHSGTDVRGPVGQEVRAPAAGKISLADPDMFFEGGLVLIDHGQSLESALMHLSAISVEAGTIVEKGDLIGKVGATGRVTGPHLHWSLKWKDRLLDPELLFDPTRPSCWQ